MHVPDNKHDVEGDDDAVSATTLLRDTEAVVLLLLRSLTTDGSRSNSSSGSDTVATTWSTSTCEANVSEATCAVRRRRRRRDGGGAHVYTDAQLRAIAQGLFVLAVSRSSDAACVHNGYSISKSTATAATTRLPPRECASTERDVYYRNVPLFGKHGQRAVARAIARACAWLQVVACLSLCGHDDARMHTHDSECAEKDGGTMSSSGSTVCATSCRAVDVLVRPWQVLAGLRRASAACTRPHTTPPTRCVVYTRESLGITAAVRATLVGYLAYTLPPPCTTTTAAATTTTAAMTMMTARRRVCTALDGGVEGVPLSRFVAAYADCFVLLQHTLAASAQHARCDGVCERGTDDMATSACQHVLVLVEKECVLRTLLDVDDALQLRNSSSSSSSMTVTISANGRRRRPRRRYIFVCTRGYPCMAARLLLRRLHAAQPSLPLCALVDGDPHGVLIALTAMGLTGNNNSNAVMTTSTASRSCQGDDDMLQRCRHAVPLQWLGVRPSALSEANYMGGAVTAATTAATAAAATMTAHEQCAALPACTARSVTSVAAVTAAAEARLSVMSAAEGVALTRAQRCVHAALQCLHTPSLHNNNNDNNNEAEVLRVRTLTRTLRCLAGELAWLQRAQLKCEMEQCFAAHDSALALLDAYVDEALAHGMDVAG